VRVIFDKFEDKQRRTWLHICIRMILLNIIFFSLVWLCRYALQIGDEDIDTTGYIMLVFLICVIFSIVATFERRLVGEDKKRLIELESIVDFWFKAFAVGIFVLIGAVANYNNFWVETVVFAITLGLLLIFDLFVWFRYKDKIKTVVVDWLDIYRVCDADKKWNDSTIQSKLKYHNASIGFVLCVIMLALSNNEWFKDDFVLGIALLGIASLGYLAYYLYQLQNFKKLNAITVLSLILSVAILILGHLFLVGAEWFVVYLVGFFVLNIPILLFNKSVARQKSIKIQAEQTL